MKPITTVSWAALALLAIAPLLLFLEIRLAGREAVGQTLPLVGVSLALWLTAVAEAFTLEAINKDKVQLQLKVMMLCKSLRFLLAAVLLIAYAVISDGDARLFAVNLIVCYLAVTVVLTIGYSRRNKQLKTNKPDKA